MLRTAPLVIAVALACLSACTKAEQAPLPPSGLAGVPSQPIPVDPAAGMPAGHPPIDGAHAMQGTPPSHGGDDGAPIPAKPGALPLPNLPGMQTPPAGSGAGAGQGVVFTGKVVERLDVPTYTYMRLALSGGAEEWVAVSTMDVKLGDTVTINQQIVMENFPSKSLGRTFPRLVMGTAIIGG